MDPYRFYGSDVASSLILTLRSNHQQKKHLTYVMIIQVVQGLQQVLRVVRRTNYYTVEFAIFAEVFGRVGGGTIKVEA